MNYLADFFYGLFLCNCIPHLAAGLRGESFPTPFARPSGAGLSSPLVNFLWGSLNLFIALVLYFFFPFGVGPYLGFFCAVAGFLLIGIYLSLHFAAVRGGKLS